MNRRKYERGLTMSDKIEKEKTILDRPLKDGQWRLQADIGKQNKTT